MEFRQDVNGIYRSAIQQTVSYPENSYDACFGVEKNSFWYNHRNEIIGAIIHRFPFEGNFADVGGGNGFQAFYLEENFPNKEVFLIEPGYEGCLNAKKYGVKNIYNAPFEEFDFAENKIGGIGLFDVIEHIEDDAAFLIKLSEHVRPSTLIYVTIPAYKWLWSDNDDYAGHYRRYNLPLIKSLSERTRLKLVYSSYFMFYTPLLTFFVRSLPYRIRGKRDAPVFMRQSLNNLRQESGTLFNVLNKTEMTVLNTFGRVIAGGSCIAVFKTL